MLLAVDAGNTHLHLGVFRAAELIATWDVPTPRERSAAEIAAQLGGLLAGRGIEPAAVRAAAIASVVPGVPARLVDAVRLLLGAEPFLLAHDSPGVSVRHEEAAQVGADRIANAVGGFARHGGPLIVVDFGTATTFDAVGSDGAHLGGAIVPGLVVSLDALLERAPRLPRVALRRPERAIGTNTAACLQSGLLFGYAGLVEALVGRIARELGGSPAVVATGGLAELLARETGVVPLVDRHLTLEGLRIACERARGSR